MAIENLLGKNSILFLYVGTGTPSYLPIGCLTSNDYDESIDIKEGTPTKCNSTPSPIPGASKYSWNFDAVAEYGSASKATYDIVHGLMKEKNPVFWKEEISLEDNTKLTTFGKAYLTSFKRSNPVDGEITFSGTLDGIGETSLVDLVV